ncbi:hypothetical protein V502_00172 [Pseudogymnoascus sp. VKM F-4520 (FW-2644)]|nr:hypothetical protein V502_00172 [Pseudogymnoascus sp. VKM F-4520 (FW-2644)]
MSSQKPNINYGDSIEPIAIIGISCRFPGNVSSPGEFWDMLVNKRSGHCEVPSNRFDGDAWQHPDHDRRGALQQKSAFYLDGDISLFDAPFFSLTAKEAMGMDPMQRHLLELAHECFENAGVPFERLQGSMTSVYTGVMTNDYELVSATDIYNLAHNTASGTSRAMLSNRALVTGVNLILHPNFNSQLSAMHMVSPDGVSHSFDDRANGYGRGEAVGAILVKPLSQALADGDTIRAVIRGSGANQDGKTPGITMPSSEAQADLIKRTYATAGLSLADTSYFEAHGTGTKIGDPTELSAIGVCFASSRSSDNPLYVGSVKTNVGHTEGAAGLAGVIKTVLSLENATLPGTVGLETLNPKLLLNEWKLAVPVETMKWPTGGLRRASVNGFGFGGSNAHVILDDPHHYLTSRNLKGRHCTIEADIPEENGGTALMQEIGSAEGDQPFDYRLLAFSMQDQHGLERLSKSFGEYFSLDPVKGQRRPNLDDLAYTLANRRTRFGFRSFAVSQSVKELAEREFKKIASTQQKRLRQPENLIFVFTGQGAQWALMGRELLSNPIFNASVQRSQQYLDEMGCKWNAIDIFQDPGPRINIAEHCQPICTILQIALVDMLEDWGVRPAATVGHSSGEIAAAYAAGGINHEDAVKVAYMRGYYCSLIQGRLKEKKGAMLAAGLTTEEAQGYLNQLKEGSVVVGCVNSPTSVTLSGDLSAIMYLEKIIKLDDKFARRLRVEIAYHSPHMLAVAEDFLTSLGKIKTAASFKVPMFSSLTTEQLQSPSALDASYWVDSMSSSVRFSKAVESLLAYASVGAQGLRKTRVKWSAALEIGPHEALKGPFNQCLAAYDGNSNIIRYTSMLRRGEPANKTALEAAGMIWTLGYPVDILKVNSTNKDLEHEHMTLSTLPPYPWQHSKGFWHEPAASASMRMQSRPRTDLLGIAVDNQNAHEPRWRNYLRLAENPWIRDHEITGTILYPAAGMMIMAIEAALQLSEDEGKAVSGIELHDVHFDRGLVIPDSDDAVETSLSLKPHQTLDSWFHWTVYSHPVGGSWTKHCYGLLTYVYDEHVSQKSTVDQSHPSESESRHWKSKRLRIESVRKSAEQTIDPPSFYSQLESIGMGYGPTFRNLTSAAFVEGENIAHGTIVIPDTKSSMPHQYEFPHLIHPATLDAFFHLVFVALFEGKAMGEASIPMTLEKLFVSTQQPTGPGTEFVALATASKINDRDSTGSIVASDGTLSGPRIIMSNVSLRTVSPPATENNVPGYTLTSRVPKRVAELKWMQDFDLLSRPTSENLIKRESTSDKFKAVRPITAQAAVWLERQSHKNANLKVLAIVDDCSSDAIIDVLSLFGSSYGQTMRLDKCVVASASEDCLRLLETDVKLQGFPIQLESFKVEITSAEQQDQDADSFDVVLVGTETYDENTIARITRRIATDGKLLVLGSTDNQIVDEAGKYKSVPGGKSSNRQFDKILAHTTTGTDQLLIATRSLEESQEPDLPVVYVIQRPNMSPKLLTLKQNLTELFSAKGVILESKLLSDVASIPGRQTLICLLEAEEPLVINWTAEEFEQFRNLVYSHSYIMWVTRGGILGYHDNSVQFAPTTGLLRTIRVEVPRVVMPHIDISPLTNIAEPSTAKLLLDAFNATSNPRPASGKENEMELVESNGTFFIPRAVACDALDEELNAYSTNPVAISGRLSDAESPLVLVKGNSPAVSDVAYWTEDTGAIQPLSEDEIEVKTTHLALNSVDFDTRSDIWQSTAVRAASGIVTHIGQGVQGFTIGDEVYFPILEGKAFATRLRQHQTLVRKVQAGFNLQEAASIPALFLTAFYCLTDVGRVSAGQRVLIHLAASDETQASIQVALALGAEVFVTTDAINKSLLVDRYKISADRIFNSSSRDFRENLVAVTEGKGFDAIISNHQGVSLRQVSLCLAELGHFIDTSRKVQVSDLSSELFNQNASFSTVDIQRLSQEKVTKVFHRTVEMLDSGSIAACTTPPPVFSISSLDSASEFLASKRGATAVLSFDQTAIVPIIPAKPSLLALSNHATYVLAGGLGALGLTIAENMVEHGARHLVFLSRAGVRTDRQRDIIQRLEKKGCAIDTELCDVTEEAQVTHLVDLSTEKGWVIKGLIQCATVLKDSIFQNMTFDKWQGSTQPKIKGTWNLHKFLPGDLDFFVVLSSISGIIGNPAQANYAAGNTYEDAIAHYRHAKGLKATTLNVGLVADASHFTADSTVESYLKRFSHLAPALVTHSEMQIALTAAMRGTTGDGSEVPVQLLVGITDEVPRSDDGLNPWSKDRKFDHRAQKPVLTVSGGASASRSLADELKDAKTEREAVAAIEYALRKYVAPAMTVSPEAIDAEKPLYEFGIDSLKAMQLRNWVFKELECEISVFDILSPKSMGQLASTLASKSPLISADVMATIEGDVL